MRYAPCRALTGGFPLCSWLCWAALALHRVPGVAGCCPLPLPGDSRAQEALKHHQEHFFFFFFFFLRALLGSGNALGCSALRPHPSRCRREPLTPQPLPSSAGTAQQPRAPPVQAQICSSARSLRLVALLCHLLGTRHGREGTGQEDGARRGATGGGGGRTTLGLKDLASALFSATGRGETQLPSRLLVARGCPAPR